MSTESEKPTVDQINPQHYKRLNPQPADLIEAWSLDWHLGNVVKYIARAGHKPGSDELEDLHKALWYLTRRIAFLGKQKQALRCTALYNCTDIPLG